MRVYQTRRERIAVALRAVATLAARGLPRTGADVEAEIGTDAGIGRESLGVVLAAGVQRGLLASAGRGKRNGYDLTDRGRRWLAAFLLLESIEAEDPTS